MYEITFGTKSEQNVLNKVVRRMLERVYDILVRMGMAKTKQQTARLELLDSMRA